ncbi:hypothetical protein I6A60_33415 [Frankia sp. AgB1.9]|uniref:hypothetical protein n=1 Tax=unclassified Frankia TaxID=2632575 RepID=UPI00193185B5|nr:MULTISPECIES: hypothetical protein [unclassified Frankia]MBL7492133.1 hypothetical protein [Frankia sp. AgW1.1]MBL7552720.1 hypothetical protein [Frankia sp. AgB1.9]MBL7625515.1 hypothetical protein [Frankia sp. AgB1.8]
MRDLRVDPLVARLLPADLLDELRCGPHPGRYRCQICLEDGDLAGGDPTSLVLRRYPQRRVRRVQLMHAGCGPSAVTVAPPILTDEELAGGRTVVYAHLVDGGLAALAGCRPEPILVIDDDDDLIMTDPAVHRDPAALLPGEVVDPVLSHALATGLALHTSLRDQPPPVAGWSVRIGPRLLDLVHPRGGGVGIERLPHTIPAEWRAAVRARGNRVTLLIGRMGLSTAVRVPYPSPASPRARAATPGSSAAAAAFAVAKAAGLGRVAAGCVGVEWTRPV